MTVLSPRVLDELPEVSYSEIPTSEIETGSWKYAQPRYEDILAPCARRCPAGNDISRFMGLAASGDLVEAVRVLRGGHPFPATLSRVCPHPCEAECNRSSFGGSVAVPMVERVLGDLALADAHVFARAARTGRKVAVVGGGPAGVTAAYVLALAGHDVEVFDDQPRPGGYLRTGIPDYRLPKSVLDRELAIVSGVGVKFTPGIRLGRDISLEELKETFAAVIIAVGQHQPRRLEIPGLGEHASVYDGVELLRSISLGLRMELPATVAVIGGGNTAVDVARSLLRLGIRPAVVYRRTRAEMPAIPCEVDEAIFEDIPFHFLASPARAVLDGSYIQAVECLRMELGAPDASGRRVPIPVPGSEFRIPARGIVAAIGETAALGFLPESAKSELRTGADGPLGGAHKGIFVAGDAATGAGTVAAAVGSGRKVAAMVDAWLRGRRAANGPLPEFWNRKVNLTRVAGIERMNPSYIRPAPGPQIRKLDPGTRVQSFDEVVLGLSEDQAIQEARRCLSCGTCNGCMNCYYFCPDVAIRHRAATSGFEVDEAHCKGCGICVEECPRGAMVLEGIRS